MNWLYYLLEANLYLCIFYAFYRLFLHRETFYTINRYYLIIAVFAAFALPFFQIGYFHNLFATPLPAAVMQTNLTAAMENNRQLELLPAPAIKVNTSSLSLVCLSVYLFIAAGFLVKMIVSLSRILHIFRTGKRIRTADVTYVELEGMPAAFSFFKILFINPNLSRRETVLEHEMVHIRQNHTADVLFFELLQIISWFNPVTYFMKQDIKLVHEYIADEQTTAGNIHKHDYALFIIENSFGVIPTKLSNQIFNHSLIKRRIKMLNKQKSGGLAKLRFLLLIPLTGGLLLASTLAFSKDYALFDLLPERIRTIQILSQDGFRYGKIRDLKDKNNIFYLTSLFTGKVKPIQQTFEKRLIVVNGKIADIKTFIALGDFDKKIELAGSAAIKKYGSSGQYGAVEFFGKETLLLNDKITPPPAPPMPRFKHAVPNAPSPPIEIELETPTGPAAPPTPIQVEIRKAPPAPIQIEVRKTPPAPIQIEVRKTPPAPIQIEVQKAPPAPQAKKDSVIEIIF